MADDIRSTPCIHCKFDNPTGARICQNCKKSQNALWATVVSVAGFAGAIAVVVGALGFLADWLPGFRKAFNKTEVNIIDFYMTNEGALSLKVANDGLNPITLAEIGVFVPSRKNSVRGYSSFPNLIIAPRTIGEAKKDGNFGQRTSITMSGDPNGQLPLNQALGYLKFSECFMVSVQDDVDDFFDLELEKDNSSLASIPHETYIRYHSGTRGKWLETKIETKSTVWQSTKAKCERVAVPDTDPTKD